MPTALVILASRCRVDEARRSTVVERTMDVSGWLREQLEEKPWSKGV